MPVVQGHPDGMTMRPLAVIGNVNVDLIMGPVGSWPQQGTEVIVDHDELRVGGAAGNTALAWMGLGVPFTIASSVGDDAFGRWLAEGFRPKSARWTVNASSTTVSVGIIHPGDERTFFTTRGHLADFTLDEAMAQVGDLRGAIVLLCGSFLTDALTGDYPAVFDWAASSGASLALDPGWPPSGWTAGQLVRAQAWLAHTDHLLVNEVEALALSGAPTVETALAELASMMPSNAHVVVKSGPRGAFGLHGQTVAVAPAPVVTVIDTIGAGDIFNAGYLLAMAEGAPFDRALWAGVALASRAISTTPRAYSRDGV